MPRGLDAMQKAVRVGRIATKQEPNDREEPTLLSEIIASSHDVGVETRGGVATGGGSAPVEKSRTGVEPVTT